MKLWCGRWVSNYKSGDSIIALMHDGVFKYGSIHFTKGHGDFYLVSESEVFTKDLIFAVCPDDVWYKDKLDEFYDAATKPKGVRKNCNVHTNP